MVLFSAGKLVVTCYSSHWKQIQTACKHPRAYLTWVAVVLTTLLNSSLSPHPFPDLASFFILPYHGQLSMPPPCRNPVIAASSGTPTLVVSPPTTAFSWDIPHLALHADRKPWCLWRPLEQRLSFLSQPKDLRVGKRFRCPPLLIHHCQLQPISTPILQKPSLI